MYKNIGNRSSITSKNTNAWDNNEVTESTAIQCLLYSFAP